MESLEWRIKKLEDKIIGQTAGYACIDRLMGQTTEPESICDQLNSVAKLYRSYLDNAGKNYPKFVESYNEAKNLMCQLENTYEGSEVSKAELVLAYEEDLLKYMQDIKLMADKADSVLDIKRWPDLTGYQERLDKLEKVISAQKSQSDELDKEIWDRIMIYKKNLDSLRSLEATWNQRLEAYENEDKKPDEDTEM